MEGKVDMDESQLLSIAKNDIKASQTLYKDGRYANALFSFQQSVEKSSKYIGLTMNCILEEQLQKDIRHDPTKVFTKMSVFLAKNSNGLIQPFDPQNITCLKQQIEKITEQEAVDFLWHYIQDVVNQPKLIDDKLPPFEAVCKFISTIMPEFDLGLDNPLLKSYTIIKLEKQTQELILSVNYGTRILQLLLGYSLLMSKYKVDDFRYPSKAYGDPNVYFNQDNPLVINLPFFIKGMESIVLGFADKIPWKLSSM
jgi:hypothetical protein